MELPLVSKSKMKPRFVPCAPCGHPKVRSRLVRAFTLVEMLVSVTILFLIVVFVSQLTNTAAKTVTINRKHMDADTQARLIFDRMAVDFANMLQRKDLDYSLFKQPPGQLPANYGGTPIAANPQTSTSGSNDQLAFYAKGVGLFSGTATPPTMAAKAPLALVGYNVATDTYLNRLVLQRMGQGLAWDSASGCQSIAYLPVTINSQWPNPFTTAAYWDTIGDQVFRFEYTYLLKPNYTDPQKPHPSQLSNTPYWDQTTNGMSPTTPHTCINGFQDVAAIVVAIAVLDSTSNAILTKGNASLANALPDAAEGSDIQSKWLSLVNSGTFAKTAGIPQEAANAVRIYQRYFYLSPPQ